MLNLLIVNISSDNIALRLKIPKAGNVTSARALKLTK